MICTSGKRFSLYAVILMLATPLCSIAQTSKSINLGDITLMFDVTTTSGTTNCPINGGSQPTSYTTAIYSNFSYIEAGVTTQLNEGYETENSWSIGPLTNCYDPTPPVGENPLLITLPNGAPINFTMSGRGGYSARIGSLLDPKYKVVSILYATPGNASSDSFTNTKTNGTVTTIGSNFQVGTSVSFGGGIPNIFSAGLTFGTSETTGQSNAFTETIANATSIGNASATSGANTINHSQDMFLIWLNPEVVLTANNLSTTTGTYSLQTQYQNGSAELPSIVEVTAETMQPNNGVTNVPISILQKQYDVATGQYDLPGLASVCADQSQYVNNCSSGGQCGCVPSDFAGILAHNPLLNTDPTLNATTATNPLNVDTSGVSACMAPVSTNSCRYVPVPSASGSSAQMSTLLSGPNCSGCNRPVNSYTQTDTTSNTLTLSESHSESIGYTVKVGPPVFNVTNTTTWTWTDMESTGTINGSANQLQYSLSSSTVGCYQYVLIYEDTVFHTFVTQQVPGNNSCL